MTTPYPWTRFPRVVRYLGVTWNEAAELTGHPMSDLRRLCGALWPGVPGFVPEDLAIASVMSRSPERAWCSANVRRVRVDFQRGGTCGVPERRQHRANVCHDDAGTCALDIPPRL